MTTTNAPTIINCNPLELPDDRNVPFDYSSLGYGPEHGMYYTSQYNEDLMNNNYHQQYGNNYYYQNSNQEQYGNNYYLSSVNDYNQQYRNNYGYNQYSQYNQGYQQQPYGWDIYNNQYGNNYDNQNYVYNGGYINIPYHREDPRHYNFNYNSNNNYYNTIDTGGYEFGSIEHMNYIEIQEMYNEAKESEEKLRKDIYRTYYRNEYGKEPFGEEFEESYLMYAHPEEYYRKKAEEESQKQFPYCEKYGFESDDEYAKYEFENKMKTIIQKQNHVMRIHYMLKENPHLVDNPSSGLTDFQLKRLQEIQDTFDNIIPEEKRKNMTFEEMNKIYAPKIVAATYALDAKFNNRDLSNQYNSSEYNKVLEFHRRTGGRSVFNPMDVLENREIHLPPELKRDKESQDRRRAFLQSIITTQKIGSGH